MFTSKNTILFVTPLATILYAKFVLPGAWTVLAATLVTIYLSIYGIWANIPMDRETRSATQSVMHNIAYPVFVLSTLFVFADIAKRPIDTRYSFFLVLGTILMLMYIGAVQRIVQTPKPEKEYRHAPARAATQYNNMGSARIEPLATHDHSGWFNKMMGRGVHSYPERKSDTEPKLYVVLEPQPKPQPPRSIAPAVEQTTNPNETKKEKIKRIRATLLAKQQEKNPVQIERE